MEHAHSHAVDTGRIYINVAVHRVSCSAVPGSECTGRALRGKMGLP